MARLKYNIDLIKFISFFEGITRTGAKDCFLNNEQLLFIVHENQIGKAVGKNGSNVKRLESSLKKRVKIVEFSEDLEVFVANLIAPVRSESITAEDGVVMIKSPDIRSRGLLIGRDASTLRFYESVVKRFFGEVSEIRIV